jgi:hypothetical protein
VVRTVHEPGAAPFRLSRHRLGRGALVRKLRPPRLRTAISAIAVMARRGGGHVGRGQRHRRVRQSDRGVRQ